MTDRDEWLKERRRINRFIKAAKERGYEFPEEAYPPDTYPEDEQLAEEIIQQLKQTTPSDLYAQATYTPKGKVRDYLQRTGQLEDYLEEVSVGKNKVSKRIIDISGEEGRRLEEEARIAEFVARTKGRKIQRQRDELNYARVLEESISDEEDNIPHIGQYILEDLKLQLKNWGYDALRYYSDPNTRITQHYIDEIKEPQINRLIAIFDQAIEQEGADAVARRLEANATEVQDALHLILYGSGGKGGTEKVENRLTQLSNLLKGSALTAEEAQQIEEAKDRIETFE